MNCRILVITDMHYVNAAKHIFKNRARKCEKAKENLELVYQKTDLGNIDAVLVLGDTVDNGNAENAAKDLTEIKNLLDKFKKPVISVCGNHDGTLSAFTSVFDSPDVRMIAGYQFAAFHDTYDGSDNARRDMDKMRRMFEKLNGGVPVIAVQHNPVFPEIQSGYPYNLINSTEVCGFYSKNNVMLSISGHYHTGIDISEKDGVMYITAACFCEEPHTYGILHLNGKNIIWQELCLM